MFIVPTINNDAPAERDHKCDEYCRFECVCGHGFCTYDFENEIFKDLDGTSLCEECFKAGLESAESEVA